MIFVIIVMTQCALQTGIGGTHHKTVIQIVNIWVPTWIPGISYFLKLPLSWIEKRKEKKHRHIMQILLLTRPSSHSSVLFTCFTFAGGGYHLWASGQFSGQTDGHDQRFRQLWIICRFVNLSLLLVWNRLSLPRFTLLSAKHINISFVLNELSFEGLVLPPLKGGYNW